MFELLDFSEDIWIGIKTPIFYRVDDILSLLLWSGLNGLNYIVGIRIDPLDLIHRAERIVGHQTV